MSVGLAQKSGAYTRLLRPGATPRPRRLHWVPWSIHPRSRAEQPEASQGDMPKKTGERFLAAGRGPVLPAALSKVDDLPQLGGHLVAGDPRLRPDHRDDPAEPDADLA